MTDETKEQFEALQAIYESAKGYLRKYCNPYKSIVINMDGIKVVSVEISKSAANYDD